MYKIKNTRLFFQQNVLDILTYEDLESILQFFHKNVFVNF